MRLLDVLRIHRGTGFTGTTGCSGNTRRATFGGRFECDIGECESDGVHFVDEVAVEVEGR